MAEVKWIKITTNIFDDEKIKLIDTMPDRDTLLVIWFKLLAIAGKTNDNGMVYIIKEMPTTDEMLATIFNRPLNTVRLALKTFSSFGMIEINDHVNIVNWDKHQNIDGLDKIREQNRKRQAKLREKKKTIAIEDKSNVISRDSNAIDIDKEIDIDIDKEIDNKNNRGQFIEFKEKLEKQFNKPLYPNDLDKIISYSDKYNINPLDIYNDSDYLKGLIDVKPTLAMFFKEETYKKMSQGAYLNRSNTNKFSSDKKIINYEEGWW
ncbi:MAG: phage replisome organizer N-terminal domain-containing protein [Cetobacterium sp.]|uniref:phage replisome organizer N-terminal domain-containing protein n=1 Tax=Cetobacterium sp. TaxID=2071632 RepID=UPI003F39BE21